MGSKANSLESRASRRWDAETVGDASVLAVFAAVYRDGKDRKEQVWAASGKTRDSTSHGPSLSFVERTSGQPVTQLWDGRLHL